MLFSLMLRSENDVHLAKLSEAGESAPDDPASRSVAPPARIPQFLSLRALRIFPALAVEITLSAMVLGLLVTRLPTAAYLASPEFHAYFLNIIGYIHYTLPGVFSGRRINVQLWTIPFELECYIALVILAVLGLVSRPRLLVGLVVAGVLLATAIAVHGGWYHKGWNVPGGCWSCAFSSA